MIASVVVVLPECLLPTTAITGIAGNDVIVCFTLPLRVLYCVLRVWDKCVFCGSGLAVCG
jgi:hypothetical protein